MLIHLAVMCNKAQSVQGSVAMSTVVQNEDNDFDIDVAVVFIRCQTCHISTLLAKLVAFYLIC